MAGTVADGGAGAVHGRVAHADHGDVVPQPEGLEMCIRDRKKTVTIAAARAARSEQDPQNYKKGWFPVGNHPLFWYHTELR